MSPTLSAYIARRFLTTLGGAALIVFALIVIVTLLEQLRRNDGGEASFGELFSIALLASPKVAMTALPFIVMLSTLACYARLARSSELVVTRAAGVSAWAAIAPAAGCAAALGVLAFSFLNPLAAATAMRSETIETRIWGGGDRFSVSEEGLWLRQADPTGQTVILARGANQSATRLFDVTLFLFAEPDRLTGRIDAARAELAEGAWRLIDATLRDVAPDGSAPPAPERFDTLEAPTALTSAQILDSFSPPDQISFWALPRFIATLERAGFAAQRHRLHWHAQLAQPLLFAAMVLIGAAFSMRHARLGGLGGMALWAVLTGFAFYFLTDVSKALGASGAAPPELAAWAPPLAAALFATGLLLHLEDG